MFIFLVQLKGVAVAHVGYTADGLELSCLVTDMWLHQNAKDRHLTFSFHGSVVAELIQKKHSCSMSDCNVYICNVTSHCPIEKFSPGKVVRVCMFLYVLYRTTIQGPSVEREVISSFPYFLRLN